MKRNKGNVLIVLNEQFFAESNGLPMCSSLRPC